jgi:MFS family permease
MSSTQLKLIIALIAAEILSGFEVAMIYAALRFMIEDFGNPEAVGWTITSFLLASAVSAAICGRLGDMFDRRRVLLIVIILSIIGSLIAGFSDSISGVVVGRVIQGSAGAIFPLCIGIVRQHIAPGAAPLYIGVLAATLTVSSGLGTVFGGVLVDNLSWHWIFFAGAIAGLVALVAVLWLVPATPKSAVEKGTNFLGGVLFAPGIVCVLLAITQSVSWGWGNPLTLGFLISGALLIALWLWTELRARVPLINVRLLAVREVLLANLAGVLLGLTWFQSLQIWSLLLQQPTETGVGLGLSATMAGVILIPMTFAALVGGPAAGWVFARYGGRFTMAISALVLGGAWVAAMLYHDSLPAMLAILTVMGIASSFFYATLPMIISGAVPMNRTSEATGMMIVIRTSFMGIGAQIVAFLLSTSTLPSPSGGGTLPDQSAYLLAMGYVVAGCVLMFAVAMLLPPSGAKKTRCHSTRTCRGELNFP